MFRRSQSCNGCRVLGTPSGCQRGGPGLVLLRASALCYYRAAPERGFLPVEATEAFQADIWPQFIAPGQRPVTPGMEMLLAGVLS